MRGYCKLYNLMELISINSNAQVKITISDGSFLSRQFGLSSITRLSGHHLRLCRGNIHPDFSATWRLHTKDEEATRFLSHIHQENYKLLVFCVKIQTVPLFILISVTWLMHSNDISNIIYFSFWWHCWREDCSRYLHSRLCSQVNVLGEGYRPSNGPDLSSVTISAPSRKVSAPSRKVTELRVMEIVSFLKYDNKMRIKMNGVNDWIHCC